MKLGENKVKALDIAIKEIEKNFGKGSIMRLGDEEVVKNISVIPSGSISLDYAVGVGGYPRGRIIEVFGPESSGKTTLSLHAIAQAQKIGGVAAFVDAEHAFDPAYAEKLGINLKDLLISQPDSGEQALEIVDTLIRSNAVDMVVVDSVAALVPRAEIEGSMGDTQVGLQARLMSQALRKLASNVDRSKAVVIFINQIRMNIGGYGNPETTSGGRALKFYTTLRLDIRRGQSIKVGSEIIGAETYVKVVKNKVAPPFKKAIFDVIYGKGIVYESELVNLGVEHSIISRKGTWFYYKTESGKDVSLGQGKMNAIQYLKENTNIAREIDKRLRTILHIPSFETKQKEGKVSSEGKKK